MKLQDYLQNNKIKITAFCNILEISRYCYYSWIKSKIFPSQKNILKIIEFTNGEVQPNDLFDLEQLKRWSK